MKLLLLLLFTACMNTTRTEVESSDESTTIKTNTETIEVTPDELIDLPNGSPRLSYFIDPTDGSLTDKLSLSKNFSGLLYISGMNLSSMKDKFVTVRFRFGRERTEIDIPATINRSEYMLPQVNTDQLVLDLSKAPFANIRLLYNLFDYNDYNNGETIETVANNDVNLYCRGLHLKDDPTFIPTSNNSCEGPDSICKYTYAKIRDIGPFITENGTYITPKETQVFKEQTNYALIKASDAINKCLPDGVDVGSLVSLYNSTDGILSGTLAYGTELSTIDSSLTKYQYHGPFQNINQSEWGIKNNAIYSKFGIYELPFGNSGYKSYLYPRFTKLGLKTNVSYLGSYTPFGPKIVDRLTSAGTSIFMDGCNLRIATTNNFTKENISSCNVSATIQILAGSTTSEEILFTESKEIKLQLIAPSILDSSKEETIFASLKNCTTNNECSSNQCCYNNKCMSKSVVGQCLDESKPNLFLSVGDICNSDHQCTTLCCDRRSGRCLNHTPNDPVVPALCQKDTGDTCITEQFCRLERVLECKIYHLGTNLDGSMKCGRRCYYTMKHGRCIDGKCTTAPKGTIPTFNPASPCEAESIYELGG